jgi:Protein ChrB, N-terminal
MPGWHLFVYRLPSKPSSARVAVWRDLRRLGALPLQQAAVALPGGHGLGEQLDAVEARVAAEGGISYRFDVAADARLEREWNALRTQEYEEIVEECETKFEREIEFEIYRGNLTAGEAEEIEADLEKIRAWFGRVSERDVFGAPSRDRAEAAIARCAGLLEDFERRVYEAESEEGPSLQPPAKLPWGETG